MAMTQDGEATNQGIVGSGVGRKKKLRYGEINNIDIKYFSVYWFIHITCHDHHLLHKNLYK
jgi:hypothetical protein